MPETRIFLLTYILFPACVWAFLLGTDRAGKYPAAELLIYSLGIAPALTALLLYYSLLLSPGLAYVDALIVFSFLLLGVAGARGATRRFSGRQDSKQEKLTLSLAKRAELAVFILLLALPSLWFLWQYAAHAVRYPIIGHDALSYGIQGRFFFKEPALTPMFERASAYSIIEFRTKHAPSFPLLLTWELILTAGGGLTSNLFFRTVGAWYGLLILATLCLWLMRLNKWLGLLGVAAMLSNSWFFGAIVREHHLDTFRIFLLALSWIWLARHISDNERLSLYLFGVCSGLAAFAHSIGTFAVCFNLLALLLFATGGIRLRLKKAALAVSLLILFGGIHYVIDIFWGRGWVLGL